MTRMLNTNLLDSCRIFHTPLCPGSQVRQNQASERNALLAGCRVTFHTIKHEALQLATCFQSTTNAEVSLRL